MYQFQQLIESAPVLRLLPPAALETLRGHFQEQHFGFGEVIVQEGDPAAAYYLLTTGRARVVKRGEDGQEIPLHTLRAGESFGEIGLLHGGVRTATVRACEDLAVLRLDRQHFNDLLAANPELREYLRLQMQHRRLNSFLRQYTRFGQVPVAALQALIAALRPLQVPAGTQVIRDGDPPGPLYIVEEGRLTVSKDRFGQARNLAFLRAGDFFGEHSLLQGSPRSATVTAVAACRLLSLNGPDLERILAEHPDFREVVAGRLGEYRSGPEARTPLDFCQEAGPGGEGIDDDRTARLHAPRELLAPELGAGESEAGELAARLPRRRRLARFAFVPQIDEADCGAAALAMVCRAFGRDVSLPYIRELCCTSSAGTSLNDLCRAATELGLAARPVKRSPSQAAELPLPAILHWDYTHWVVLLQVRGDKVQVADPAQGLKWLERRELEAHWSGYAARFLSTEAFAQAPVEAASWDWVRPFLVPFGGALGKAVALTVGICVLQALIPLLTALTVDQVIAQKDARLLTLIVVGLGATLGLTLLLTMFQRRILTRAAAQLDSLILGHLMAKMLALPMTYFLNRRTGDIQRRLEGVRQVRRFVTEGSAGAVLAAVQIVVFLAMMAGINLSLTGLFVAIMVPLYGGIMFFAGKILRPAFASIEESEARFQTLRDEVVRGIEVVKSLASETRFQDATVAEFGQVTGNQSQSKFNIYVYEGTVQAVWFLSSILLLWWGAHLAIAAGETGLSVGRFIAFYMLIAMSYTPVMTIMNLWEEMQATSILLARLRDLMNCPPEQDVQAQPRLEVKSLAGKVELHQVSFRYGGPAAPAVLQDLTFTAAPGQKVAIVGRNGAGKTTLAKLLACLLAPTQGEVRFDGVAAAQLDLRQLRRHLGVVMHDSYLFAGSLLDNVAFGDPEPNLERVRWVCHVADLGDFIARLPHGYQSIIGEGGITLSRGQEQSLAIARALYRDPAVFILDEATSDMDGETEHNLQERLSEVLHRHTLFVITHRLNLIRDADLILVLDKGRIVEQGGHDELMTLRGLYYHLFTRQTE